MTPSPRALFQLFARRFLAGFLLLCISAAGWPSRFFGATTPEQGVWLIDLPVGMIGFLIALQAIGPMARLWYRERLIRQAAGVDPHAGFDDVSLPRRVFLLLLEVARADGQVGPAERELVRRFLLARFIAPEQYQDLHAWEAQAMFRPDIAELAARIALTIAPAERATLFSWACMVAFADGSYRPEEHAALQQVARGLGLMPVLAQALFHQARERWLRNQEAERLRQGQRQRWQQQRPRQEPPPLARSDRQRALDILGLDESAGRDAIRRRHRQLVKQFHPDAQPNLGPVAQQEATERFRAIQRAYEILSS